MASTLLVSPDEVFDALGQNRDLMEESTPAVKSAILRAMIKLEGLIRTPLGVEVREDTFYVSGMDGAPLNKRYTLHLTNGFVRKADPITVSMCGTVDGTYTTITNAVVQHEKGKVIVPNAEPYDLLGQYLKVSYSSGFDGSGETPEAVKQALICFVPLLMLSTSAAAADPKQQAALVAKATSADSIGADMVSRYLRPLSNSIKPLYSTLGE